jgi:hypothetical protein
VALLGVEGGSHLGFVGTLGHSITGVTTGGQIIGTGVHLETMGVGVGVTVGISHLMVEVVGSCSVGSGDLIGVGGVKMLTGAQRIVGVSAALPRESLKLVSAERIVLTMMKERMNFMMRVSVVV